MDAAPDTTTEILDSTAIPPLFEAPFRRTVARRVLENKKELRPDTRSRLETAVRAVVRMPGFRDPVAAPAKPLSKETAGRLSGKPALVTALLDAWCELNPQLRADVEAFLAKNGIPSLLPERMPEALAARRNPEKDLALADGLIDLRPDLEPQEVRLMTLCLTQWVELPSAVPVAFEIAPTQAEPVVAANESPTGGQAPLDVLSGTAWEQWRTQIRALPPDWPHWGLASAFLEHVQVIAAEKCREAADLKGASLGAKITELIAEYAQELNYLQLAQPVKSLEDAGGFSPLEAASLALDSLREELTLAREAIWRKGGTFKEDQRRQADIASAHGKVQAALAALAARVPETGHDEAPDGASSTPLEPPSPQEPPPTEPAPEDLTSSEARDPSAAHDSSITDEAAAAFPVATPLTETPAPPPRAPLVATGLQPPAAEARQVAGPSLAALPDSSLAERMCEHWSRKEAALAQDVLLELQCRWLSRGQNLRAYLAALFEEESIALPPRALASWLCWLAVMLGDEGAMEPGYDISELQHASHQMGDMEEPAQRFFVAWMCTGLLGPAASRALPLAKGLPDRLLDAAWATDSKLDRFLLDQLLEPARRGRSPKVVPRESVESLRQRLLGEMSGAASIVDRAINYQNGLVRHYWIDLVGQGGPVQRLLADASAGRFRGSWPDKDTLAADVDGWHRVQARYRTNILNRLSTFLIHLRAAESIAAELRVRTANGQDALDREEIVNALQGHERLIARLEGDRAPSLVGYRRIIGTLTSLAIREAGK